MSFLLSRGNVINRGKGNRNVGREKKFQNPRFNQIELAYNALVESLKRIGIENPKSYADRMRSLSNFPTRSPTYMAAAIYYIKNYSYSQDERTGAKLQLRVIEETQPFQLDRSTGLYELITVRRLHDLDMDRVNEIVDRIQMMSSFSSVVDRSISKIRGVVELIAYIQMVLEHYSVVTPSEHPQDILEMLTK